MNETYYAGAYWGARRESPEACARRAELFFAAVADVDPSFSRWFKRARSRKSASSRQLNLGRQSLEQMFRQGKDPVLEQLGFSLGGWNGAERDQDAIRFDILCGSDAERVSNLCLFHLPSQGPNFERTLTAPVLTNLVRCMAVAWEPDWAVATSRAHRDLEPEDQGILVGWVTYLSHRQGRVPPLPAPVRVEPVEDRGTLITLTPERFTASNPEHVALATRVRELLAEAGLLTET